ncbi:LuxR C-terminal-related transcriptional regulator, partial [Streptomyces caeruleatus]
SGLDDESITRKLEFSRNTVRDHGAALYRKIGIQQRSKAIVWSRGNGFPLRSGGARWQFY